MNKETNNKAMTTKQLHRIPSESVLGGVAAGLADYFGIDKVLVRVIFILLVFAPIPFPVVLVYFILWIVMPKGERFLPAQPTKQQV
ncbi:PspC domain-containing protein [Larkinella soli]|uniref:PspC domain-containing protein n=1 Tax=Larkinella soli TaxID=1770527 RepID=UPI001E3B8DF6|nr:PspC domain-containing protein [Larkinella soli]